MSTLQEEQPRFDRAVCDAMVASAPGSWRVIELRLERALEATATGEFTHMLSSPEGHPPAFPDDSLFAATYRLDELLRRHGGFFRRAFYRVELSSDSWVYRASFDYDKAAKEA